MAIAESETRGRSDLEPGAGEQRERDRALSVRVRGIDHLALNTDDMAGTVRFYTEVLGMRLIGTIRTDDPYVDDGSGAPPYSNLRHYFFDMGGDSTVAFFEYPRGVSKTDANTVAAMQHCAFHVTREDLERAQRRLEAHGVRVVGPINRGPRLSIYFYDNNGIRLEFTTATQYSGEDFGTIETLRMPRAVVRRELETLYADPADVERILGGMPLLD